MIDTGSTRTLITEKIAETFFIDQIKEDPFQIKTPHSISLHKYSAEIPVSKIFKKPGMLHTHYIFNFSQAYDGLIGLDLLQEIGATLDFKNGYLSTDKAKIPLFLEGKRLVSTSTTNEKESKYEYNISPKTEVVAKIPTSQSNGEALINSIIFENQIEISAGLINVKDNEATVLLINNTDEEKTFTISEPLPCMPSHQLNNFLTEPMDIDEEPSISYNSNINYDNLQKKNLENLDLRHCNQEEYEAIRNLCYEYRDIFYCEDIPLTFTNQVKHEIRTTDNVPIYTKSYRFPHIYKSEVKKQINSMLDQKIITNSTSPWSSPIWIVPKKMDNSGKRKFRIVIDYRKLNEKTIPDKFPIPNITDVLDKLGRSQYFTTLDLASGYHQIEMDPKDIEKTAFSTDDGHYEFLRMPFGLRNAPSTFQRTMNHVLSGLQNKCLVYMDDVLIFSTSLQEHIESIRLVFDRFRKTNFKIQLDKSEFLKQTVKFLGHIITPEGILPNPDKIEAIVKFPIPNTKKEIQSFLGLIGYYRKFIKDCSKLTRPLTSCLKKGAKIEHTKEFVESFETCKKILTNSPLLQHPDFSKPFILTTDASKYALGSVLSQGVVGSDKPIAYASRTLNESEKNYSVVEKELLSLVWSTQYFRPYLYGRRFTVYTDHRPLRWLFSLKDPQNSKFIRWRTKLQDYDFDIEYKKGKLNTNADALSRIEIHPIDTESMQVNIDDPELDKIIQDLDRETELRTPTSEEIDKILNPAENVESRNTETNEFNIPEISTILSNEDDEPRNTIQIIDDIINSKPKQIFIKTVLMNPRKNRTLRVENKTILYAEVTKEDNEDQILELLRDHTSEKSTFYMYFDDDKMYEDFCRVYNRSFNNNGPKLIRCTQERTYLRKKEEINETIQMYHESKTNHRGSQETYDKLKQKYYWNNMLTTIQEYINKCNICQKGKYDRRPPRIPMNQTPTQQKPFEIIFMDTFTIEQNIYLTLVDSFSKFGQAIPIKCKEACEIARALIEYFEHYGTPAAITTDNGREFINNQVKNLLAYHKIDIHFTTPFHPESNGIVERFHSTLIEHFRIFRQNPQLNSKSNGEIMKLTIIAYNHTNHSTTGYTPFDIIFGHSLNKNLFDTKTNQIIFDYSLDEHRKKLSQLYDTIYERTETRKTATVDRVNKEVTNPQEKYKIGQNVYVKQPKKRGSKTVPKFDGPFPIISINSDNTCMIRLNNNKERRVHLSDLKSTLTDGLPLQQPTISN